MKTFTIEDIRSWEPCYDPNKYLPEEWCGTALDILDDKRIPLEDRLWVILRTDLVSERLMRLFAVWCARQVQHLMTDARSIAALDVAERFANGQASREELDAARAAAWAAAAAAREAAAWDAARAAADAAGVAAGAAAWAAAFRAAGAAAFRAAVDAAWAAVDAAWAAQEKKLREMLISEGALAVVDEIRALPSEAPAAREGESRD